MTTDHKHEVVIDDSALNGTYSWFCKETPKGNCDAAAFGFTTAEEATADAIRLGYRIIPADERPGRYDGIPGLVWYSKVTPTRGDELKIGDWLDSLDHSGARRIYDVRIAAPGSGFREVCFSGGWTVYSDGSSDTETVRDEVVYDVVDPESQVAPDGERVS